MQKSEVQSRGKGAAVNWCRSELPDNQCSLLDAALYYADLGWSVIPIRHRDESGKQPACATWKEYQTVRPQRDQIMRWFRRKNLDGLAVIFGPASGGLACRDFDAKSEYDIWAAEHPQLAQELPTVETCRGRHVYFKSRIVAIQVCANGELRGNGYCLLPPSKHPTGSLYRWVDAYDLAHIPELDPFAAGLARETERTEKTERTELTERTEITEDIRGNNNCSVFSVLSVSGSVQESVHRAIETTVPSTVGERNRAIFAFARQLKAIPALADAEFSQLRPAVKAWHERALPVIGTKPFEDTWGDFIYGWERVQFPAGTGPLEALVRAADAKPLPTIAENYEAPETRRLVALCRELQESAGSGAFFLSCRTVAGLFGIDFRTAWRRLHVLVADGVLAVAEPGTAWRATRYRYLAREGGPDG